MPFDLTALVAAPSFAPREWQSAAPRDAYGGQRPPVQRSADLDRVLALPRRMLELDGTARAEAIVDVETERYGNGATSCRCAEIDPERHAAEGCVKRLRLVQALALREISICGGLGGPIGVGHGKTLLDLLAPLAFARHAAACGAPDADRLLCVLLVPPKLVAQLVADYDYVSQHFVMPSMVVQGAPQFDRVHHGRPRLQVMPYSRICLAGESAWLSVVQPHAIIADECHKLRDRNTATTARVMRYFEEHPRTRFAGWSGSITSKSIRDYAHLFALALKNASPLPIDYHVVEDWARAIDPGPRPADPGPLLELCAPGEALYGGIRRRIAETLGVVSTTAPSAGTALEILEREAPEIPAVIADMISRANAFERPDGEELVTAMQAVECACQLACGFHYKWIYPHNMFPRDTFLVLDWLDKRKEWHRELRQKLKDRAEHLDSPQLCQHAAERALGLRPAHRGLPTWHSQKFKAWHDVKHRVRPESVGVRVDDFLVRDVVKWAREHRGVIWYQYRAFAEWISEIGGIPVFGAGDDAKAALLAEKGDRSVLCSMRAIGTGTNGLQFKFSDQLYTNLPADPSAYEQTLGRLHRPGQSHDVRAWFYLHTKELRGHVSSALRASLYVDGTMGGNQKLRVGFPTELEAELDGE